MQNFELSKRRFGQYDEVTRQQISFPWASSVTNTTVG